MNRIGLLVLLTAAPGLALANSPGDHMTSNRECDRLIGVLQGGTSAEAHAALERMRVFRQSHHYQACVDAGRSATAAARDQIRVTQLVHLDIVNDRGVELGDVQQVAKGQDGRAYVVTRYRGPRWPGDKQVALPLESMTLQAGRLVIPGLGADDLHRMPSAELEGGKLTTLGEQERVFVARSDESPQTAASTRRQP